MKNQPASRPKPIVEHAPTVIHHPEDDETLLARWLRLGMEQGTRFWLLVLGSVAAVTALLFLINALSAGDSARSAPWAELAKAKDLDARLKVAEDFPRSPAAPWVRLQVASARFNEGVEKLATDRIVASPLLKQALEQFRDVARESAKDTPQASLAALGIARTLEALNQLKEAGEQYRLVASTWPGTDEAKQAERLAEELRKPEAAEFYRQLYAYKPTEAKLPPAGRGIFDTLPPGHPPVQGPLPALPGLPPESSGTRREPEAKMPDLPLPFGPELDPESKAGEKAPTAGPDDKPRN